MIKTGDPVWLEFNGNTGEICRYNGKVYAYESLKNAQKALGPGERNAVLMEYAPKQQWISTKEKLPRPGERVLVNIPGCQFVGEMYITDAGHWKRYDGNGLDAYLDDKAKWWMPMPPGKDVTADA